MGSACFSAAETLSGAGHGDLLEKSIRLLAFLFAALALVAPGVRPAAAANITGTITYNGGYGPIGGARHLCLCVYGDPELKTGFGCLIRTSNHASFSFGAASRTDYYLVAFVDIHLNDQLDPDEPFEIFHDRGEPPADAVRAGAENVDFDFGDENLPGAATETPTATESPTLTATPTEEPTATASATATPSQTPTPVPSAVATTATPCGGDCDASGAVTIDEIVTLVNLALTGGAPGNCSCPAGDVVTVDCIVTAIQHALNGCLTG